MSFKKRRLDITISLGEGGFGESLGPDVTLSGYRCQIAVVAYNGDVQSQMQMRIFGLSQDMINRLTVIGPILTERRNNRILVAAGDQDEQALTVVYEGTISQAWADYNQAPEVVFNIVALAAAYAAVKPVGAKSYRGSVLVSDIAQDIASDMGMTLENNGVDTVLSNPYFPGTSLDQLKTLATAARINYTIDKGVISIWPRQGNREASPILIDPAINMLGYPSFTGGGIEFTLLYTPELGLGNMVQVVSTIEAAHGEWIIVSLSHQLEAEVPGGAWVSKILCQRPINV